MLLTLQRAPGARTPRGVGPVLQGLAGRLQPARLRVQLVLGGDALLRRLNRDFRGRDRSTDVLSFLYERSPSRAPGDPDAEIYVSLPRAASQARERGHTLAEEVVLLGLHGLLHLQGHDHHRPAETRRMRAAEAAQLAWARRRWPRFRIQPLVPGSAETPVRRVR